MKTTTYNRIAALMLVLIFAWTGCDTVDPKTEPTEAPGVIPEQAFALDVDFFDQEPTAAKNGQASHFLAAVWRVSIAKLVTGSILFYPAALTHAVMQVKPVYRDGGFVWAAETTIDGRVHGVELKAIPGDAYIDWTMRVSGIDDDTGTYLEDFVLYTAQTGLESKSGDFEIFFPIDGASRQVMDGAYEVASDTESTLSFSIPADVPDIGGAAATYHRDGIWMSMDLTGPEGGAHFIEWNTETHEGSITASDYNNGEQGCWNQYLLNTDCPAQ